MKNDYLLCKKSENLIDAIPVEPSNPLCITEILRNQYFPRYGKNDVIDIIKMFVDGGEIEVSTQCGIKFYRFIKYV